MPGFLGTITLNEDLTLTQGFESQAARPGLIQSRKSGLNWYIEQRTINKFLNDKPFFENKDYLLLVEGVILNRKALEKKYQRDSFSDAIISAYRQQGEAFFNEFRGSFSGLFYDKIKNIWIIYTNHIGDKQVFYATHGNNFIFGSEPGFVIEYYKHNGFSLSLNEQAAYMLLTYGFFIENHTLTNEVKKLTAGHFLRIVNGKIQEVQYHRFCNEPDYTRSQDEWIEGIDYYFRQAVKLQFDKDVEYGYKHITTLSGGLDSRMTVWVAHHMGYTEQLNTTFSQSNYLDEIIAKKIATDLRHEWLFKALDHGNFLFNIDEITETTYGGASYAGLAHGKSLYDMVNFEPYGLAHTGQIGDAILGTFYQKPIHGTPHEIGDGAYSTTIIEKLNDYIFCYDYANSEIFVLYTRAFNGANQGLLVFQAYTESISPFLDIEFISFCYSIPVEKRFKHKIYLDWIFKKYSAAGNYIWEKTKKRIETPKESRLISLFGRKVDKKTIIQWLFGAVKRRIFPNDHDKKNQNVMSAWHMNPLDYWLETNKELKIYLDDYCLTNLSNIYSKTIAKDYELLYKHGNAGERFQALTFLSAVKLIWDNQSDN